MPPSPVMMNVASNGVVERLKRELDVVKKSENLLRDEVKRLLTQNEESLKQYVRLSIREMRSNTLISLFLIIMICEKILLKHSLSCVQLVENTELVLERNTGTNLN